MATTRLALLTLGLVACRPADPQFATANDHRTPAGTVADGEVTVALEARAARWRPAADDGPALEIAAFGEVGQAPSVPGPLIRVPAGANVTITLVNRLTDTLRVTGLIDPRTSDTLVIAPGGTGRATFQAQRPGLYGYAGRTRRDTISHRGGLGGQLAGVIAVDSAGAPADRIFAITSWSGPIVPATGDSSFLLTVNGRIWPHTERLRLAVGDSAHWRVINFANSFHPMHLHGAYFRIDARGTWTGDTASTVAERRLAVTEVLRLEETMTIAWSPERPGHWLFHCHDAFHVAHEQETDLPVVAPIWAAQVRGKASPPAVPPSHGGASVAHGMAGLVMGIEVTGGAPPDSSTTARRLDLSIQERPRVYGDTAGIGFVLARPGQVPADSITIPGPPLVIRRGEPTAVTVHNRLTIPTSVHWHGLELESFYDGVAGWSGTAAKLAPSIAPGDSFVAHFTPPRAGTFIYHSHFSEVRQLSLGMYGALIVLEPGARWDPDRDRVVLFSQAGVGDSALVVAHHAGLPLRRRMPYRLRFINITVADDVELELIQSGATATWRLLAKDGADLPDPKVQPARLLFGPGETVDVEFIPGAGPHTLRVKSFNNFDLVLPVR
ncbi:MAG: multicopper oxidase domain-containing protein [Gemmatimonadales bacterium]